MKIDWDMQIINGTRLFQLDDKSLALSQIIGVSSS